MILGQYTIYVHWTFNQVRQFWYWNLPDTRVSSNICNALISRLFPWISMLFPWTFHEKPSREMPCNSMEMWEGSSMDCPWFHGMSMAFCAKLPWTFSSYFPPLFCQIYPGQGVQILQAFSMDPFSMDFHGISMILWEFYSR